MTDFMQLAEISRNRRAIIIPLLESIDNVDFQNVDCTNSIPFDMGLEQVPANAIITPMTKPPTVIFCPSQLPTVVSLASGQLEYDHLSILTLTDYSFFWVKSNGNLSITLVYIGGVHNEDFERQTSMKPGDQVALPHIASFAVVQEPFAELFQSILSNLQTIMRTSCSTSAFHEPREEKEKEALPHASSTQLKEFSKFSAARPWYDDLNYARAFQGKALSAGNLQMEKINELSHAAETTSGPLTPNVTRLSLSKTIAACCGIFNKVDGVSITDFSHPSDGPILTKSHVIDALRNFILYSSHLHGQRMQRPLAILEHNIIGINRNWRSLTHHVLILLVDDTLNKFRSVPFDDDTDLMSSQLTSIASYLEWNNTELFAFMISHKFQAPTFPAWESSSGPSTDPPSAPPKKKVRFDEPCPFTGDICWNWVAQRPRCKDLTCSLKPQRPHAFPPGTSNLIKQSLRDWISKKQSHTKP